VPEIFKQTLETARKSLPDKLAAKSGGNPKS
jgi:hypothetical protein